MEELLAGISLNMACQERLRLAIHGLGIAERALSGCFFETKLK